MSIQSHTERPKLDEMYAELYYQYVSGRMNEDDLIESLSKFPQDYLERRIFKRPSKVKTNLFFIKSQIKDTWQRVKEIWNHDEYKKFHRCMIRVLNLGKKETSAATSHVTEVPDKYDDQNQEMKPPLGERTDPDGLEDEVKAGHDIENRTKRANALVSVSYQNGKSSQNESHSTELIPENIEMEEEMMIPVMDENNRSDLNGSEDEIKERHDKNKIQGSKALEDPLLDECQRSNTDGLEDESKEEHKTKSKNYMSSNGLVSASNQNGKSSQNESHSTKLIPENRGMQEEMMIPVMDENNRSDLNGSEDEIKERHDKNKIQVSKAFGTASHQDGTCSRNEIARTELLLISQRMKEKMVDSMISKISITDGLEDESKEEHITKIKKYMSSIRKYDIQFLKPSGSQSPIVDYQEYELFDRQNTRTNDKLSKGHSSALPKYRVQKKSIFQKDGAVSFMKHLFELEDLQRRLTDAIKNAYKSNKSNTKRASNKKNAYTSNKSNIKRASNKTKVKSSKAYGEISAPTKLNPGNGAKSLFHYKDISDDTGNKILPSFQLFSLMSNDLFASTLDFLDERTYSQTDLIFFEVNRRGRRKYLLFTRFWMVTGDLFSNAIALTAHISDIYYTGIYPTDCRMNLYLPCLIGNYLQVKDEIDERLPRHLMLNTQEPINGGSRCLTGYINHRINL